MIKYIIKKEAFGPYHEKTKVELPNMVEVTSNKYSNM